jgi:segregation and condensation protein A
MGGTVPVASQNHGRVIHGLVGRANLSAVAVDVQTPVFEGPFDLLLHLILREQVELYDINLCAIVDAYVAVMVQMDLDLEAATEFLLIAATLVELKTRRLLPDTSDGDLDEELGLWEERDRLLARLLECKTFKDAAAVLERLHATASQSVPRACGPDERFVDLTPDALEGVTPDRLRRSGAGVSGRGGG